MVLINWLIDRADLAFSVYFYVIYVTQHFTCHVT